MPGRLAGVSVGRADVGPELVLPDEPARLVQDAAAAVLHVDGAEPHRAGGVEETAGLRLEHREAGPLDVRVEQAS